MSASAWVEVTLVTLVLVGLVVVILLDPAHLADKKYGPKPNVAPPPKVAQRTPPWENRDVG